MVRSSFLTSALMPLLASPIVAASLESPRPFEALLPSVAAAAPGTYVVNGTSLLPVPDDGRIALALQADVLKGPDRSARVAIAVGAEAAQPVDARVLVSRLGATDAAKRLVADAGGAGSTGALRLVRELQLEPGDYELAAVVGETRQGTGLVTIARTRLTVPDMDKGELVVTPIVTGDASASQKASNSPFVFGPSVLAPATSRRRSQEGTIEVAFRVYNWSAGPEEKPDLTVEYLFYEQGQKGAHFFNKLKPQQLNETTLGSNFAPSAGVVAPGMRVPLAAFTFGDFRMVVRVSDNRSHKSAEQTLAFTVAP
jgi:hypothetical protein